MSDIVERLRDKWKHSEEDCYKAADEIERLRAEIARLREALEQIVYLEQPLQRGKPRRVSLSGIARAALAEKEEK